MRSFGSLWPVPASEALTGALRKAGNSTEQLGKWHLGDKPENFPTANGFDEYDFLPYYAGVYAYDNTTLHPNFPRNDPEFMAMWDKVNRAEWEAKPGEKPHILKDQFNYSDLATADDDMRARAVDYIKAHANDSKPFFMYLNFEKVHNPKQSVTSLEGKISRRRELPRCVDGDGR